MFKKYEVGNIIQKQRDIMKDDILTFRMKEITWPYILIGPLKMR